MLLLKIRVLNFIKRIKNKLKNLLFCFFINFIFFFFLKIQCSEEIKTIKKNYLRSINTFGENINRFVSLFGGNEYSLLPQQERLNLQEDSVKNYFLSLAEKYEQNHEGCSGKEYLIKKCTKESFISPCFLLKQKEVFEERIGYLLDPINFSLFSVFVYPILLCWRRVALI